MLPKPKQLTEYGSICFGVAMDFVLRHYNKYERQGDGDMVDSACMPQNEKEIKEC